MRPLKDNVIVLETGSIRGWIRILLIKTQAPVFPKSLQNTFIKRMDFSIFRVLLKSDKQNYSLARSYNLLHLKPFVGFEHKEQKIF